MTEYEVLQAIQNGTPILDIDAATAIERGNAVISETIVLTDRGRAGLAWYEEMELLDKKAAGARGIGGMRGHQKRKMLVTSQALIDGNGRGTT